MNLIKRFLVIFFAFFLVPQLHSQSQSQSLSQALDEQILNLENFQLDFKKATEDVLNLNLQLSLAENQLKELQTSQAEATKLSQELSKTLNESEMRCRFWRDAFIVSTTIMVITTGTTVYLISQLNK